MVASVRDLAEAQAQSLAAVESFSRYVPVEVVRELVAEGDVARIGGQSREMTLLFSDIADFTRISEGLDPQALADALTPRTRLVALSHVIWTTGRIMPIARMAELVRAHGAVFLVDAAQGPGCIPVDVRSLGCEIGRAHV